MPAWTSWVINLSIAAYFFSMVAAGSEGIAAALGAGRLFAVVFMIVLDILGHREAEAFAGVALIAGSVWFGPRS